VTRTREIHLWGDGPGNRNFLEELISFFKSSLSGIPVTLEGNIWDLISTEHLRPVAEKVAGGRVFDLYNPIPEHGNEPISGEITYEEGRILGENKSTGLLYDGFFLSKTFMSTSDHLSGHLDALHIVLTERLVGTFDRFDRRYHARAVIFGYPHIVSITGVVEAPARPREYYLIRRQFQGSGMIPPEIHESMKGRYLEHGDPRIGEVLKGLALQTLFYQATGDPFCDKKECRLFNAHWQEELIYAQIGSVDDLCDRHRETLESFSR
jgi:hypothetical protein